MTSKRYRDTRSGQWVTAADNAADPDHVTAETIRAPEDDEVNDEMVEAAAEALWQDDDEHVGGVRGQAIYDWSGVYSGSKKRYRRKAYAALEAAFAVKRAAR